LAVGLGRPDFGTELAAEEVARADVVGIAVRDQDRLWIEVLRV
jgi:hypothetical protein